MFTCFSPCIIHGPCIVLVDSKLRDRRLASKISAHFKISVVQTLSSPSQSPASSNTHPRVPTIMSTAQDGNQGASNSTGKNQPESSSSMATNSAAMAGLSIQPVREMKAISYWHINNFAELSAGSEKITSPIFFSPPDEKGHCYQFAIEMHPTGAISSIFPGQVAFSLVLGEKSTAKGCNKFKLTFHLLDSHRRCRISHEGKAKFLDSNSTTDKRTQKYNNFLLISRDFVTKMQSGTEDKIILLCTVVEDMPSALPCRFQDVRKMCEDLGTLLPNADSQDTSADYQPSRFDHLTDCTLVIGDSKLRAHKAILSARSPVFGAMFEHECEEKQSNEVNITDFPVDVMEQFLRYIYTGSVKNMNRYAAELLPVADKYQMDALKYRCEQHLGNSLTIDNVIDIFILADLHGSTELKAYCVHFITEHPKAVMANTKQWDKIKDNADLLIQLYQNQSSKRLGCANDYRLLLLKKSKPN